MQKNTTFARNAATEKMEGRLDFVLMSALLRTICQLENHTVDSFTVHGVIVPKRAHRPASICRLCPHDVLRCESKAASGIFGAGHTQAFTHSNVCYFIIIFPLIYSLFRRQIGHIL